MRQTRAGCSYLKQLCTDEFDLYREFFNTGEEQLYQYLETLCDYLYDDLRPHTLHWHEPRLTAVRSLHRPASIHGPRRLGCRRR